MRIGLRKSLSILLITGITLVSLTGCSYSFSINSGEVLKKEDAKEFTVEKTAADSITQIDISTRVGDVELIPSDQFYVEINYLYWDQEPEYSLKDGKLSFDDSDTIPNSYSINFDLDNTIKIYLPDNAPLKSLKIDSSSGDVALSGFVADDMDVDIAYGDLAMEKAAAADAKINLSCGDSTFNDFQSGILDFVSSYGDAYFTKINTGDSRLPSTDTEISIKSSSGDISLDSVNSLSITLIDSYGDVSCTGIIADTLSSELSSGDFKFNNSDVKKIKVENSYGDADLGLLGEEADYAMDLNTSYGSITVGDQSYEDHFQKDTAGNRMLDASLSSGDITVKFEGYK